jgi:hypothetical protein
MRLSASLCGCATYRGRLSCAQILEAADSIGVTRFLCRILDTDFGEFFFFYDVRGISSDPDCSARVRASGE